MKKLQFLLILIMMTLVLIITQTGCSEKTAVSKTSYYMDTMCQIDIYDMENMSTEAAEDAIRQAFALCADYESLLSATKEESDIYKLNHAGGASVKCNPRTVDVIQKGIRYGKLSDGIFDITIGRVAALWDFHDEKPKVPAKTAVMAAMQGIGYEKVVVDGDRVTLENPDIEITLGGVGKGYVADRAAERLEALGVTSAVINFGGNVITIGDKEGKDFIIGITKPFAKAGEIAGYVEVKDATVVTSGIYERGFEADGKYYHHILDVNTGWPIETDVVSVTLIGEKGTSADCDAMSTICLMLGVEEGLAFIESTEGIEALFIDQDGNLTQSRGLKNFVQK